MKRWKVWAGVAEAEGHEEVLEQTERRDNHRFGDVLGHHRYLMVTLHQVMQEKNLQPCSLLERSRMLGRG
jgi:hypothetical protein